MMRPIVITKENLWQEAPPVSVQADTQRIISRETEPCLREKSGRHGNGRRGEYARCCAYGKLTYKAQWVTVALPPHSIMTVQFEVEE